MPEETKTSTEAGGTEAGTTQTSTDQEIQAGQDPKLGEEGGQTNSGQAVFGGEEADSKFKTKEDAERSYKEQAKFVAKLQQQLKEKEQVEVTTPPKTSDGLEQEVAILKADLKMREVFDDFATEHPQFKGRVRSLARDVIETHIRASKTITMDHAYKMALAISEDTEEADLNRSVNQRAAAAVSMGGTRDAVSSRDKSYTPTQKEVQLLNELGLSPESQARVLEKVSGK